MKILLDDETLSGPQATRITIRPERTAVPIDTVASMVGAISFECQLWGGANTPLVPVSQSGAVPQSYLSILAGSAIDRVRGMDAFGLYHLRDGQVNVSLSAYGHEMDAFGRQLAVALLPYRRQQDYQTVEVVQLSENDPWKYIYAACLGLLPDAPSEDVLRHGEMVSTLQFEDFVNVRRVEAVGSLSDLLDRLADDSLTTPRQLSMLHLQYGDNGRYAIGAESGVLPDPDFARRDAGPNVVVVCSPGNVEDLALLWNLRSAHGDYHPLPIGIPADELGPETIQTILEKQPGSQFGLEARHIYVTSTSINQEDLYGSLSPSGDHGFHVVDSKSLLTLGKPAGWSREDVVVWAEGKASFVPLPAGSKKEVLEDGHFGRFTRMQADLRVLSRPFPAATDVRVHGPNSSFYAGAVSMAIGSRRAEPIEVQWPSRLLAARAVAKSRGLEVRESEPGRAARIALNGFTDLWEVTFLAHAPLLRLIEEMAARSGFGWLRQRARQLGRSEVTAADAVAPTTDQLPEKSFSDFKRALRNNAKATRYWLIWAEGAGLLVKGFRLLCPLCSAKQWVPVAAFSPPIICRGCAEVMDAPFGDRDNINFTYRISERLRRLYEHEAMGHLLTMRFFNSIFTRHAGSDLTGMHPGMEVFREDNPYTEGEADVLLLQRNGAFIPSEVKRSFSGVVPAEVSKLDHLVSALNAPWSAIAVCEYGSEAPQVFIDLEKRAKGIAPFRVILSYDRLLDPTPIWSIANDPLEWNPLSSEQIDQREAAFVERLARRADEGPFDWLAREMLRRPGAGK